MHPTTTKLPAPSLDDFGNVAGATAATPVGVTRLWIVPTLGVIGCVAVMMAQLFWEQARWQGPGGSAAGFYAMGFVFGFGVLGVISRALGMLLSRARPGRWVAWVCNCIPLLPVPFAFASGTISTQLIEGIWLYGLAVIFPAALWLLSDLARRQWCDQAASRFGSTLGEQRLWVIAVSFAFGLLIVMGVWGALSETSRAGNTPGDASYCFLIIFVLQGLFSRALGAFLSFARGTVRIVLANGGALAIAVAAFFALVALVGYSAAWPVDFALYFMLPGALWFASDLVRQPWSVSKDAVSTRL